eukprot:scaffold34007_cov66-Phaeocystis_antarctica.AAC.5
MDQCECHAHAKSQTLSKHKSRLNKAPFAHLTSVCTMYTKREIRAKLQKTHAGTPVAQLRSTFTARDGTFPPPPRRAETLDGRASGFVSHTRGRDGGNDGRAAAQGARGGRG